MLAVHGYLLRREDRAPHYRIDFSLAIAPVPHAREPFSLVRHAFAC
jgi:hypothetical protein